MVRPLVGVVFVLVRTALIRVRTSLTLTLWKAGFAAYFAAYRTPNLWPDANGGTASRGFAAAYRTAYRRLAYLTPRFRTSRLRVKPCL